ncbi:hypothetical protein TNCV_2794841 [Trichonephila clavipes]|nr:hypothetical protein TNCV_2794841 [Trichonephila clavipes]
MFTGETDPGDLKKTSLIRYYTSATAAQPNQRQKDYIHSLSQLEAEFIAASQSPQRSNLVEQSLRVVLCDFCSKSSNR